MNTQKYKLKPNCAEHYMFGKKFVSGDVIETVIELDKVYPAKFELEAEFLARNEVKTVLQVVINNETTANVKAEETKEEVAVTVDTEVKKYPFADEAGLSIVDLGRGWFNVIDPDDGDKVVNSKKLRESELEQFINNYVNGVE